MKDLCLEFLRHWKIDLAAASGPLPEGLAFLVAASEHLLILACLTVPVLLVAESRRHAPAQRRVLVVLAALFGCLALAPALALLPAGSAGSVVRFTAAVLVWGAALALLRCLPNLSRVAETGAGTDELERLRRLDAAMAWSGDGVLIASSTYSRDPSLRVLYANPAFTKMTGHEPQNASVAATALEEMGVLAAVETALQLCLPTRIEVPGRRSDGTTGWAEWHIIPLMGNESGRREWMAILRDITARRTRSVRELAAPVCRECNETIEGPGLERTESGIVRHIRNREEVA